MLAYLRSAPAILLRPALLLRGYQRANLRPDLIAGITVGMVLLPQSLAFALLAGLPPTSGLYAAVVASVAGALWGSSSHLNSGPTNTASILLFSVLLPIAEPGSPRFIAAAGLIAVMAGALRLIMGLARLGLLVNFVSDAVAVGFTAGAGILIMSNQIKPILRLPLESGASLPATLRDTLFLLPQTHLLSLGLGLGTAALIILLPRLTRRLPAVLLAIIFTAVLAWALGLEGRGVEVLGPLPAGLPPLADLPILDLELIGSLSNGALALAIIGLVEAVAISRAVAGYSHERIDNNQEFIGQGVANICAGLFSGYPCSGSFNRSALSYQSGGRSAMSNVFAGLFVLLGTFLFGVPIAHLPRPTLAGALLITAYSMIDRRTIMRIWRGAPGDAVIMVATLVTTLLLPLQFAVLTGVLMSLGYYLLRTSAPRVYEVLPDADFRHWEPAGSRPPCPQLAVIDVLGDLYFGAVSHIEERVLDVLDRNPTQRFLLLRMHSVQHCDISGIRALENMLRACRSRGGDMYMVRVRERVLARMQATGFAKELGAANLLEEDAAIGHLFHRVLDPAVCIYECEQRAFRECQNLPKRLLGALPAQLARAAPGPPSPEVLPRALWEALRTETPPPLVVDVREPREYRQAHVPGALHLPLSTLFERPAELPRHRQLVLVCRSGRRSVRAAALLRQQGYTTVVILAGGLLAWQAENLLTALD